MEGHGLIITGAVIAVIVLLIQYGRLYYGKADVVILVLSSREHYNERQAIRDTWMNTNQSINIEVLFVVGQPCFIHPNDRTNQWSCQYWNVTQNDLEKEKLSFTIDHSYSSVSHLSNEFKFTVLHPILMTSLSFNGLLKDVEQKSVSLIDRRSEEEVLVVNLNNRGREADPFTAITLEKGFEGVLVVDGNFEGQSVFSQTVVCSSLINCDDKERIPIVGFTYQALEKDELEAHITNIGGRNASWEKFQNRHSAELDKEIDTYEDIILLDDVIDVYRNLPSKLLGGIHRIRDMYDTRYIMKTDDDSYINTDNLVSYLQMLSSHGEGQRSAWIGKSNWKVYDSGKWAEFSYQSLTYPPFACGSGYIITEDVVNYLSDNEKSLQVFQGEDISMGIWLAALQTRVMDFKLFSCENLTPEKAQDFISIPDISQPAQNLHKYHKPGSDSSLSTMESVLNKYMIFFGFIFACFLAAMIFRDIKDQNQTINQAIHKKERKNIRRRRTPQSCTTTTTSLSKDISLLSDDI